MKGCSAINDADRQPPTASSGRVTVKVRGKGVVSGIESTTCVTGAVRWPVVDDGGVHKATGVEETWTKNDKSKRFW